MLSKQLNVYWKQGFKNWKVIENYNTLSKWFCGTDLNWFKENELLKQNQKSKGSKNLTSKQNQKTSWIHNTLNYLEEIINIYDTNYEFESKIDFVNISDMSNVSDDDALDSDISSCNLSALL